MNQHEHDPTPRPTPDPETPNRRRFEIAARRCSELTASSISEASAQKQDIDREEKGRVCVFRK